MSRENFELVRRVWDEVGGRVPAAMAKLFARMSPEVEFVRMYEHPGDRLLHGLDVEIELQRLVDAGEKVVGFTRWSGRGKGSGAPVENQVIDVFTFARGEIVRWEVYEDAAEALRAAGVEG